MNTTRAFRRILPFVLVLSLAGGCLQQERDEVSSDPALAAGPQGESWVEAWDCVGPPPLPSLAELETALGLSEEQSAVVAEALEAWRSEMERWRATMRERTRRRDSGGPPPGGHGMPGGFGEFEPPMLGFLEAVVPALDPAQVTALADLLESARADCPQRWGEGRRGGRRGPGPGMFFPHIIRQLDGLTTEQAEAIRDALQESGAAFHELRRAFAGGSISAEELRDRAKELRESVEAALASILTDDQLAALEDALAEHRAEMAERRLEHLSEGIDRRVDFLATVLELTGDQRSQVEGVLNESVAARREVLEALRDGTIEIEDALYRGYVIAQEADEAIRALLTPEQIEVFDALRRLLPGHRRM